jgi:16S rRNA (guanine(966)-N(2))-methyltransferase RsmD
VRIVAGEFKGRNLKSPTWEGLRPTSDRLRETLFNILGHAVHGARVLDGYAGTGAVGIEALSRGAAQVTFVEQDRRAIALIEANLALLAGVKASGTPPRRDVIIRTGFAPLERASFEVVVLDPPYAPGAAEDALAAAAGLLAPGGCLVVEHAARHAAPAGWGTLRLLRTVKAGDSALSFYGF